MSGIPVSERFIEDIKVKGTGLGLFNSIEYRLQHA